MKSLNSYIYKGFFNNVGATPLGAKEWWEAYKIYGGAIANSNIRIDDDGSLTIDQEKIYHVVNLEINSENKDILIPGGYLHPKINFKKGFWDRIDLWVCSNVGEISLERFPKKLKDTLRVYTGQNCDITKIRMSDWMADGRCRYMKLENTIPVDPENLPKINELEICFTSENRQLGLEFKKILPSLLHEWEYWDSLKSLMITFYKSKNISHELKEIFTDIDTFVKNNCPELYKHKAYDLDTLVNNPKGYSVRSMIFE